MNKANHKQMARYERMRKGLRVTAAVLAAAGISRDRDWCGRNSGIVCFHRFITHTFAVRFIDSE